MQKYQLEATVGLKKRINGEIISVKCPQER